MKLQLSFVSAFGGTLRSIPHAVNERLQRLLPASPRKRMLVYISLILLVLLLCGSAAGWLLWQNAYRASPQYAVDMLNKSLATRDVELFANSVDCALFARHFTASTIQTQGASPTKSPLSAEPSAYEKDPDNVHFIMEKNIQDKLLFFIQGADTAQPENTDALLFLSPTLLGQLVSQPFVLEQNTEPYQAVSQADFPFAPSVPLQLTLVPTTKGWRIGYLENDSQLIALQADFLKKQNDAAQEKIATHRAAQALQINTLIPEPVCKAAVSTISGGVHLLTYTIGSQPNAGKHNVLGWRVDMDIISAQGTVIRQSHLDQTGNLTPGNPLHDAWSVEVSPEDYEMFKQGSPLTCLPQITFISLSNGVIYRNDKL